MNNLTRREFLKLLNRVAVATGLSALVAPIVAYFYPAKLEETPSEPVLVGDLAELPVGTSKTVRFGRYPALVIHSPAGFRAYSAICTHFACVVKWDSDKNQIVCPCHDGFFAVEDGSVISGPPPTALETLPVEIVDGQIYVGGTA
jgi:Rieske Fe-S protein